ncbi:low molecular weight protein arginine phosphatase [bacterium]|nr:low molecular weight protein arginine phosphatase [bacterium]
MSKRRVLMVCTGNTCRSPLAEVLLRKLRPEWEVRSAGVMAGVGPASKNSRAVAAQRGLNLDGHRSQSVSQPLLDWADEVLCMTENHRTALQRSYPGSQARTLGREISDPVGQSLATYQRCADQIEAALQDWLSSPDQ